MVQMQRVSVSAALFLVAALCFLSVPEVDAQQLVYRYYRTSCPNVEKIVRTEVEKAFKKDPTIAPGLLRMVFHDCFVRVSVSSSIAFLEALRVVSREPSSHCT